jgi:hypothetical protein
MTRDLDDLLEKVKDEASFIAFIDALAADFEEEGKLELVNPSQP